MAWSYYPKFVNTGKIEKNPFRVITGFKKRLVLLIVVLLSGEHCISVKNKLRIIVTFHKHRAKVESIFAMMFQSRSTKVVPECNAMRNLSKNARNVWSKNVSRIFSG